MDAKLFARIGAVAFVAIAITMSALQLRKERVSAVPEVVDVTDPDSDPLPEQLRQCNAMGEAAARDPICYAAWAEKRRRFLGVKGEASRPATEASTPPSSAAESQPAKGQ